MLTMTPEGRRWLPWIVVAVILAVLLGREMMPDVAAPPATSRTTMSLLRSGDPGVCAASDVAETLRDMIRPAGDRALLYRITLSAAVLESFDQSVTKAVCRTNIEIRGRDGSNLPTPALSFAVQPSADDANKFVVWASTEVLQQQLADRIAADDAVQQQQQEQDAHAQQMRAIVSPRWLRGRWVFAEMGSEGCASENAFDFQSRGRLFYQGRQLGWKLGVTSLSLIDDSEAIQNLFVEASADRFTLQDPQGSVQSFRRCAANEMRREPPSPFIEAPAGERSSNQEPSSFEDPTYD